MFFAKQFKYLLDKVKELDPDANVVPSLLRIDFNLPVIGKCRLEYDHHGFDDEYDALGTIKLYYDDNMTEFDSLQYTIDGLDGLMRSIERRQGQPAVTSDIDMESAGYKTLMKFLGESIEENSEQMYTIEPDYEDGYEDNFTILLPESKGWTDETVGQLADIIANSNPNSSAADRINPKFNNGKIYQIYVDQCESGQPIAIEDFEQTIQDALNEIWGTAETVETVVDDDADDIEQSVGSSLDTGMMDHYDRMNGDIGDIDMESAEFGKSVKKLCDVAGKPALAEAVIKLYKIYNR